MGGIMNGVLCRWRKVGLLTGLRNWLRAWLRVDMDREHVVHIASELGRLQAHVHMALRAHADLDNRGQSFVVLVGQFRNKDHVQVVALPRDEDFQTMLHAIRQVSRGHAPGRVDAPVGAPIREIIRVMGEW